MCLINMVEVVYGTALKVQFWLLSMMERGPKILCQ
jgi:hypothetical protein